MRSSVFHTICAHLLYVRGRGLPVTDYLPVEELIGRLANDEDMQIVNTRNLLTGVFPLCWEMSRTLTEQYNNNINNNTI